MTEARSIFENPTDEEPGYFEMIDRAAAEPKNKVISNGKPGHAVYLVHKFLESAERTVKICTGRLTRQLDGVLACADSKIAEAAIDFLRQKGSELIVVAIDKNGTPKVSGTLLQRQH